MPAWHAGDGEFESPVSSGTKGGSLMPISGVGEPCHVHEVRLELTYYAHRLDMEYNGRGVRSWVRCC